MHEAGQHPKPVLWDNLEGSGGAGGGRGGSRFGGHMYTYGKFNLMYGKKTITVL